ncbi:hypothetical protein [Ligilactobacillus araffinosus]|uniref:ABC transmembrane type-1 domain-containing protein n=1 Tax=Ligilactobacillus araffinosus DSM 20653 TaxID=1423820 RepID=A0A0R1ZCM6_9LACO|nr:hypothetical protein [Ligilactobacillus araffinosus]KRM52085.1 hypothetical protein FC64_GL001283 [Ligilactobacillus araffinosus DSM 20653]
MIRILAKSIRENKKYSIIVPFLVLYESLAGAIVPFLMGNLIDQGITKENWSYICKLGTILLLIAISAIISGTTAS